MYGSFNEKAQEAWDFARCQRADGSYYGTGGKCRKGDEVSSIQRDPSKDVKRGNTMIGTSPLNKIADNIKEFETRLKDARSDAERAYLNTTIKNAKKMWLSEKAKEWQKMAAEAHAEGWRDRALQYSKEAGKLLQEKADLDRE